MLKSIVSTGVCVLMKLTVYRMKTASAVHVYS